MEPSNPAVLASKPRRTVKEVLLSYFYWTYPRGSFHYDVMVTLILLFIFVTPFVWNYGEKPSPNGGPVHPIQVVGNDDHGFIVTVPAVDVTVPDGATDPAVKKILRKAIEPVTGDAVFVERWETVKDAQGNPAWKIWAHR
jgi:hypothetical protein